MSLAAPRNAIALTIAPENPSGKGGVAAIAQRSEWFFAENTHPEAFGFCPSQEGIGSNVCCAEQPLPLRPSEKAGHRDAKFSNYLGVYKHETDDSRWHVLIIWARWPRLSRDQPTRRKVLESNLHATAENVSYSPSSDTRKTDAGWRDGLARHRREAEMIAWIAERRGVPDDRRDEPYDSQVSSPEGGGCHPDGELHSDLLSWANVYCGHGRSHRRPRW